LFGPTDPRALAPMSLKSTYIWKEEKACYDIFGNFSKCEKGMMNKISVEDVIYAAKKYLRL
jgi:hypothetical protein